MYGKKQVSNDIKNDCFKFKINLKANFRKKKICLKMLNLEMQEHQIRRQKLPKIIKTFRHFNDDNFYLFSVVKSKFQKN